MNRFLGFLVVFVLGVLASAFTIYYLFGSPRSWGPQSAPDVPRIGVRYANTGNNAVRDAATTVSNYVVNIDTIGRARQGGPLGLPDFFPFPFERPDEAMRGQASGVIFSPDGFIVTNNHVVEDASQLWVTLHDERRFPARVIGRDPKTDLAVIKIDSRNLPYARFANSRTLQVGDWVIAVGNALGLGPTVTIGLVSAKRSQFDIDGKVFEGIIQTDAAINRGNSGGALADINGNLVGINTAIASVGGGSIGIGFAIPSDTAKTIAEQLKDRGKVSRPWLGITYTALNDSTRQELAQRGLSNLPRENGALVVQVVEGSPAAEAGLRPFDVILKLDGKSVCCDPKRKGAVTIAEEMADVKIGQRVTLDVWRTADGRTSKVGVRVREVPADVAQ